MSPPIDKYNAHELQQFLALLHWPPKLKISTSHFPYLNVVEAHSISGQSREGKCGKHSSSLAISN